MVCPDGVLPGADELFDHAACGLLLTTPDGTIRRANNTFCQWTGYDCAQLSNQRRIQDLLTMGGKIFHQTHWAPLLQMQGSVAEVKLDIVHRDGHKLPMMVNAVRRQRAGVTYHELAMFVAEDRNKYEHELLLARKQAEQLLLKQQQIQEALTLSQTELARQRAQAEDRALFAEQMVGIVSHDLRNPLSAIQLGARVVAHGELATHQKQALARINNANKRAQRLIADLLDFTVARVGRGVSITLESISLHQLVSEALDELRPTFAGRILQHRQVGAGPCRGDADRLAQILGNLVANATTYGAFDSPVLVTTRIEAETFALDVHNQGNPIATEVLPTLFEPMTRGVGATNSGRSVGLGLFIVREIARAHGGDVLVSSTADTGTTFTVRCPR
ncbi:MAG TPA: PAS domain-containing sensor histidine kinase [Rubrivivax sp.]|nr:PAS domain-containing sensor histidine kinase [Rubrivivax sp.]